jgi:hypothetical protein
MFLMVDTIDTKSFAGDCGWFTGFTKCQAAFGSGRSRRGTESKVINWWFPKMVSQNHPSYG